MGLGLHLGKGGIPFQQSHLSLIVQWDRMDSGIRAVLG